MKLISLISGKVQCISKLKKNLKKKSRSGQHRILTKYFKRCSLSLFKRMKRVLFLRRSIKSFMKKKSSLLQIPRDLFRSSFSILNNLNLQMKVNTKKMRKKRKKKKKGKVIIRDMIIIKMRLKKKKNRKKKINLNHKKKTFQLLMKKMFQVMSTAITATLNHNIKNLTLSMLPWTSTLIIRVINLLHINMMMSPESHLTSTSIKNKSMKAINLLLPIKANSKMIGQTPKRNSLLRKISLTRHKNRIMNKNRQDLRLNQVN